MARAASKSGMTSERGLVIERRFSTEGVHPFDELDWEIRDAVIGDPEKPAFEQRGVEFPKSWSQNATNIVAQKYFRGQPGAPDREFSVKQMVNRVAGRIAEAGREAGYFASDEDGDAFEAELSHILVNQKAAFNSPVWFNVGWKPPGQEQASACFILSVEDDMDSILSWNTKEGIIFKGGSGSGINLSKIRGSMEPLSKGGIASGPVSFMRGADSWAGAIKSGGGTRRAAKMVVLDVDHPDIEKFIWCKADEEKKAAALKAADFDMRLDSEAFASVQFQNANNSVRVTDEFMEAVAKDEDWDLVARTDGSAIKTVKARELMEQIADAAWQCADPGIQYDSTINRWHTDPNTGPITASNPCSEYMSIDDSACNLASLNLMKFRNEDGSFAVDDFTHAVDIVFLAQEILVGFSSYPTEQITENARAFRQLGLGYANLGALLMAEGLPYDSDEGRAMAGAITALMTGRGYRKSAEVAAAVGPYDGYRGEPRASQRGDADAPGQGVRDRRRAGRGGAAARRPGELGRGRRARRAARLPERPGDGARADRDDQLPDGLRHDRDRARLLPGQVQGAGRRRPDEDRQPLGQPGARDARLLGLGDRADRRLHQRAQHDHRRPRPQGRAPAGVRRRRRRALDLAHRPHRDDGRRPAVHLGGDLEDGQPAGVGDGRGHRRRLHLWLDPGPEGARDLPRRLEDGPGAEDRRRREEVGAGRRGRRGPPLPERQEDAARARVDHPQVLDRRCTRATSPPASTTDGSLGEIFLTDIGKEGSTMQGPDERLRDRDLDRPPVRGAARGLRASKFSYMRFEPEGITRNPEIPFAKSLPDYIMRWLASRFIDDTDYLEQLGILTDEVRARKEAQQSFPIDEGNGGGNGGNGHANGEGNGHSNGEAKSESPEPKAEAKPATAALTETPPVHPGGDRGRSSSAPPAISAAG